MAWKNPAWDWLCEAYMHLPGTIPWLEAAQLGEFLQSPAVTHNVVTGLEDQALDPQFLLSRTPDWLSCHRSRRPCLPACWRAYPLRTRPHLPRGIPGQRLALECPTIPMIDESFMMQLTVNGQPMQMARQMTAGELLDQLNLRGRRLAMEINGELLPRSQFDHHVLSDRDRVEIVHAIGGG